MKRPAREKICIRYTKKRMMQITLILFLTLTFSTLAFGQSLFFKNLKNSMWTSETLFNVSTIKKEKEIGLTKLAGSINELKIDRTIWTFKDELIISHYNLTERKDSIIGIYNYEVEANKGHLRIILDNKVTLTYKIGIISTGNYALLIKKENE